MCDQNALLRFLAAQATAQQQMAFGRQTAAPQRALGGPMMGPMLGMNPFVAPEMMLWQSMMAAQAQAQMAQLQQQQAQSQPSFDEVLKKLAESAKTADKDKSNAHSSQIPSTSGATATAIAKEEIRLEPGEIPKPMRSSASKHTAMNKTMLDTAMWQLLASQLLQQQASLKMNGHPVRSSKKEVSTSVNSGVLDLSGKNISEPGPSSSGTDTRSSATPSEGTLHWENNKKRPPATENQARLPLKLGWRRQTCIRSINASGVRGDVVYYAPCGKKLSTYAEVLRYLMKNNCGNITRDNFSFSSKLVVGEFLMPKESAEGEKLIIKMTEDDINEEMNKLFRLKPLPRIADKKTRDERVSPEEAIDHFEEAEGAYDDEEKIKWSREPIDDLLLTEIRPLPDLPRINNLQLSGTGFADALMVYEFVHNFAHVLAIDSSSLPTLESFCTYLAGETENCSEVLQLTETLFRLTLEYPGLPSGKKGMTKLGQSISDVGIKKNNYSELMRLFLASRDSQGIKLSHLLSDSSFECLGGEDKAAILAFLCNELLCCPNIVAEIDRNLDEVGRLKGDRWMRDGKARALRVVQKKKEKIERAHLEECEGEDRPPSRNSEGSDGSRPGTPVPHRDKKLTPGLGQCEILTEEEENMSPEELENLIRSLNLESTFLKEKINILTMKVRSFPFGTDRFHRQYWQLPHVPAVLVESVESAGVTNPACNADQICGKDPQGVSGSHFIDPDVAACIEDVIDEVVAAKVHGDRKRRKRIRRMENTFKRGWWTIDTRESLEAIRSSLHGRGIRERALHRLLCKNWFLNDVKLGRVSVDVVVHETNREEIANSEIEIVHKELNSLYEKIREAGVQNKYNESLIKTDADVKSLEHNLTYGNRQIAFRHLKQAIVACEHSIDRSYLRPSFCIGDRRSIAYTLKMEVKNRVEEHVDDEEHPYERDDSERDDEAVEEGEKDEIDRRETIERWRSYVYESTTTAQMIIAIQMLHSCIAWERSTVLNLCQICRTRCNEEEVQCKKCGLGFHVKCLKISTPCSFAQWNCAACIELSSGHPTCMICCRQDSTSRPCRKCYNFFHVDCSGESTISPQMEYICTGCDMKQFERKVILRGESEERAEMEETVEVEHQKEPKRAPKRKSEAPPPIVFPTDMNSDLCRAMLDEMEAQPVVGPFMEPVDLDLVTGYREAIANPIDISTIRNRIDAQCYESPEDFASDVELMFSNCRTFNEDESPVGIAGATLHKFYQKRWRQLKYNFSKRLKRMRPSV